MTDIVPAARPGDIALPDDLMSVGMEDFAPEDAIMPTIRIDHKEGVFVDALSGEKLPKLDVVILGMVKQRVLWEPEIEENSKGPLCRSYDFAAGLPDEDRFPWKHAKVIEAGWNASMEALPCATCPLAEWGSHPNRDTPWCSEQHTFAVMQTMNEDGDMAPSLLTVQRSALKPSRTYLTSFSRSRTALFTVRTTITLDHRKRGNVDFAVPVFAKGVDTDPADYPLFARNFLEIKEFVTTPRFRLDAGDEGIVVPPDETPGAATAPAAAADEDDLPF